MSYIKRKERKKRINIVYPLYIYWIVFVIWQNIGIYTAISEFSLLIKAFLVAYLGYHFLKGKVVLKSYNFLWWLLFAGFAIITRNFNEIDINGTAMIHYYFPLVFSFFVFVASPDEEISKKDYLAFLKLVIIAVTYMALYSIIFQTNRFTGLLSVNNAYGNELNSFFVSSHEYAFYLVYGIISVMICYQYEQKNSKRFFYLCLLLLFGINLLATFSRTSYLACGAIVLIFTFFSKQTYIKKWLVLIMGIGVAVIIFIPQMREFAFKILLKENNDADRFELWGYVINEFGNFGLLRQLIGGGFTNINTFLKANYAHGSVHNGFFQVLLVWGIIGLIFLISVIVHSLKNSIKIYKEDRNMSVIFLSFNFAAIAVMLTNTSCLMQSTIDSYMMTVFLVVIPKYVSNAIKNGRYEDNENSVQEVIDSEK